MFYPESGFLRRNLSQVVVLQRCCIQDYRVDKVDKVDKVDRVDKNSQILGSKV